jgi:HSP20 family protein
MGDAERVVTSARRVVQGRGFAPAATAVEVDEPLPGSSPGTATDIAAPEEEGPRGVDKELEALFQELCSRGSVCKTVIGVWHPPTDVFETADHVVVKMEVAGVRKEDLDVSFDEHCLRIRGRREERFTGRKVAVSQMEIEYGVFERNISIPHSVDADRIEASYGDGFLVVRILKRRPPPGRVVTVVL